MKPTSRPVTLLAGQALSLGLLCGFVIIPAAGIFLAAYGARALAFVYLAVAVVGAILAPVLDAAMRRWPLRSVAAVAVTSMTTIAVAAWIVLEVSGATWVSFVLQVVFPMLIQTGFLLIGAQAGQLLTVREMKERFSRVVFGFVLGFFASGLVSAPLLAVIGGTHRLLVGAALSGLAFLGFVVRTGRQFGAELGVVDEPDVRAPRLPVRSLFRQPLVLALLAYQFLSMLGSQLVEYLVFDRAAARISSSTDLARFTSGFTVALNLVDIVFVAFVAGALLRRFGMRFGLVVNPGVVAVLLVGAVLAGAGPGMGSAAVFVALGAARILDITLTDGATRGSINTAYQALPPAERLSAQAYVEGLGQPIAIGVTGLLLLVLEYGFDADVGAVLVVALAVCGLWTFVAVRTYRSYRDDLHQTLRARVIPTPEAATGGAATAVARADRESDVIALLGPALENPATLDRDVVRLLRRCPRGEDAGLAGLLHDHVDHPSRDVGLEVVRTFAKVAPPGDPRREEVLEAMVVTETADLLRILGAMVALEPTAATRAVHDALADERRLVRDRTLAAVALVCDRTAVARAAQWLDGRDPRAESVALESIEVLVPSRLRHRTVALIQTSADPPAQLAALARAASAKPTPSSPAEALAALRAPVRDDAASSWTGRCAAGLGALP